MHHILLGVALFFLSFGVSAEFVAGTDIPLMDEMIINDADGFSFDTPAGQIRGITAEVKKSVKEVQDFYQSALSELGWKKVSATLYVREQDELSVQITPKKQGSVVKIQYAFPNK